MSSGPRTARKPSKSKWTAAPASGPSSPSIPRPDYTDTDTEPFPATPAKWSYRATYTHDAQRIGQWSNVAEITVGG